MSWLCLGLSLIPVCARLGGPARESQGICHLVCQAPHFDRPTRHSGNLDVPACDVEFQHQKEFGRGRSVPESRVVDCPDGGDVCLGDGPGPKPPASDQPVIYKNHTDGEAPEREHHRNGDEQPPGPQLFFGGSIDGVVDPPSAVAASKSRHMIEAIRAFQLAMTRRSGPGLDTVQGSHGQRRRHDERWLLPLLVPWRGGRSIHAGNPA